MKNLKFCLLFSVFCIILTSCSEDEAYAPKKKAFHHLELPDHRYVELSKKHPYFFEHSLFAEAFDDTTGTVEPHWINLYYKDFDATIQLTYKDLKKDKKKYAEIVDDAVKLANKHQVKAYSIEEIQITTPKNKKYYVYELTGDVPSQFQFYATDTNQHFLRGALYFNTATKNDSLAPVIEFIKMDIIHLLNTLEWRN
ncbi:MAG: gliding motility lipoprotein GldD [Cytophagales bacterium]